MSARVFIHPRCVEGPAAGALAAHLQGLGYDVATVVCGPANKRGRHEMVRVVSETPYFTGGKEMVLERFDGSRFTHRTGQPAPEPSAA